MADRTSLRIARVPGRYEGGADLESLDSESNLETDANHMITAQHTMDANHLMITQPIIQSNSMVANPLVCKYCDKLFKNKKTLQNHYKLIHSKNVNENMNRKIVKGIQYKRTLNTGHDGSGVCEFECNICDKRYSNESSIKRHINNAHNDTTVHKCSICNKVFSRKEHVERHNKSIKCSNQNELSTGNDKEQNETVPKKTVICEICQENIPRRYLKIHREKIHSIPHEMKKPIICPMKSCSDAFPTIQELRIHLKKQEDAGGHNMEIKKIVKSFNNIQEFQDWKDSLEWKENVRFVPRTMHIRKDGQYSKWYTCHRSGKYRFGGKGIRKIKTNGTCKIGRCCPAGMKIMRSSDGTVKCIYNITHAGHGLNGPNIIYVPLHKIDKQFILERSLLGVPADRIHKELMEQGGRAKYSKLKDVKNIMKRSSIEEPKRVCDLRGRKNIKRAFYERCEKAKEHSVEVKSVGKFKVTSQVGESHEVTWLQSCECINDCSNCGVCMHMFECDCEDYSNENVCKHIHSVGYFNDVCEKAKELAVEKISGDKYKVSSRRNENHEVVLFQFCSCLKKCRCGICKHLYKCNCTDNSKGMCKHVHAVGHFNNDSLKEKCHNIVEDEVQMFEEDVMPMESNRIPTSEEYIEDEEQILRQNFMPETSERDKIIEKMNDHLIELQNNLKTDSNNPNVPIEHFKKMNEMLKKALIIYRSLRGR